MACSVYTASAGAGKTSFGIALAREAAASLRAQVRVCVPRNLQAHAWRTRLARAGGALGVHVFDFDTLVSLCLDASGETSTRVDSLVQYHLLRSLAERATLPHYEPIKTLPGFIQNAQVVIERLKSARLEPEPFAAAAQTLGAEPRLLDLAALYGAYQDALLRQGWADIEGLRWLVVDALERNPSACADWPLLIFDGFDDFTPIQLDLLNVLAGRVGDLVLLLPSSDGVAYPRYERTRRRVEARLGLTAEPLPASSSDGRHPELAQLAVQLFGPRPDGPAQPTAAGAAVEFRECPDPAAEVREALRWLKRLIVHGEARPADTAILARDLAPYRPFVRQVAQEFGLPVRLAGGLPLERSPVIDALLELMRLHLPGPDGGPALPRRATVAAWRSPYFDWSALSPRIDPGDADRLDALARRGRVIRGLEQWETAFAGTAARVAARRPATEDEEEPAALLALTPRRVADLRARFDAFVSFTHPPDRATTRGYVAWLERLIGPDDDRADRFAAAADDGSLGIVGRVRRGPTADVIAADLNALRALKDVLRGLVWVDEALSPALSGGGSQAPAEPEPKDFTRFLAELAGAIVAASYDPAPPGAVDAILVVDVIQARGLGFEAVAVLGLSEGSFPATIVEDAFLRDADRAGLGPFGYTIDPSTDSAEREFFYEAITRPRRRLLLTRSILADNGAVWDPSPFWEAVVACVGRRETRVDFVPASRVEWREVTADRPDAGPGDETDARIRHAAAAWRARERDGTTEGDLSSAVADLARQFGPDHIWSPSRLEKYQTCAYSFFVSSALALEPRQEPTEGLDNAQLGTLYHHLLEAVYRSGVESDLPEDDLRRRVADIAAPILERAPEELGFQPTRWWEKTKREVVENVVQTVWRLPAAGFTFHLAEQSFGRRGSPPLVLEDGEQRLQFSGMIDRIDLNEAGEVRIIDYKTGGAGTYVPKAFEDGRLLQLPLYALAVSSALRLGPVVDGFYWHLNQAEKSKFELRGQVEDAAATAAGYAWAAVGHIRAGDFVPRPPSDGCPTYCPAAAFCWHYEAKW